MSTTLLPIDASRTLEEVELVIERGLVTFIEVGKALFEIKENRLYRQAGFTDFDAYCQTRWGWQRAHAYRLMDAANVAEALSPTGDTPSTERQARELNRLKDPEAIRAAWDEARERYSEQPTSAQLREVVDELSDLREKNVTSDIAHIVATMPDESRAFVIETDRSTLPQLAAQRVIGFYRQARRAQHELEEVDPADLHRAATEHDDVANALQEGVDVGTALVAVCQRALGANGLRRIV